MSKLAAKSLKLLIREPVKSYIIKKEFYSSATLLEDIKKHSTPDTQLTDSDIFNILIKYFYAYIYPDSITVRLSLEEITTCFNQFVHRRLGSDLLWNKLDLRKKLLKHGFALAMLADLPKTAHIFREIACRRINPGSFGDNFMGLDIGAGTGILMLAQWLCARKNNFTHIEIFGIERDPAIFDRTGRIVGRLCIGRMSGKEAKNRSTYCFLNNSPVTFISNETLPGASARLWKEDFIKINKTLFDNYAPLLESACFFPNQVLAADKSGNHTVILSRENSFHKIEGPPLHLMYPRAIELQGQLCPLPHIGSHLRCYLEEPWPDMLSHRW
ncbi:MAG: hypothetical protein ACLFT1_05390 [Desulfonatronovibrio sp.]